MAKMTEKQKLFMAFIVEYKRINEMPPTLREIANYFGYKHAMAAQSINSLVKKGYLLKARYISRGIAVTEKYKKEMKEMKKLNKSKENK